MTPIITHLQGQVGATLPTANAGGRYTGTVGTAVSFNASGSTTPAGSGALSYAWDLTGTGTFADATGVSPTYTFAAPRSGLVGVRVTNATGGIDIAYAPITVTTSQTPPSVNTLTPAGPVQNVAPGTTVNFSANVTHTASGPITYQWTVDGTAAGSGTTYSRLFAAADVGLHSVALSVTDAGGSSSRRLGVLVAPPLPLVAAFTPPATAIATDAVQFTDSSTGPIARRSWDFGDGTPATPSTSTLQNPTHTYASAGTYQVALTVSDGSGGTNQVIQPVIVQPFHVTHQDTFGGPALDPFWTWNAGGRSTNGYAFTPAGLALTASNSDYTPGTQSDPRLETTQSGDWTTTLQVKALVQQSYDMVGLLGSDPTNPASYWKFGYAQDDRASALPSIVLYDAAHGGGLVAAVPFPSSTTPYLQVVKTGTSYTFAYSLDGSTWKQLAQATYPFGSGPVRIAPFAQGTNRTFTGTIVQLAFNTSLPGAAQPTAVTPAKPTFSDNFGGSTLNSFWSFNQGSNAADSYLFTKGGLALTSSFTDYYPGNNGNPYLYTSQTGDWDARVQVDATVSQNYDEIGLIAINPSNPNAFWKDGFGFAGSTYVDVYDGSSHGGPANVFPTTASPYLRVTRIGDVYTFYYSSDGTTWTQNYQGVWHFGDTVRLGLFAQGTSRTFTGRFVQFALSAPLPGPLAATPGVLFKPTGESTNVALDTTGATITASSGTYGGSYLPAQMLSATPTAPWVTPYSQTANQYATIQLAGNRTYLVDHVQVQPRTDCCPGQRPQTFAIETSVDGATFTPALYGVVANTANLQDFAVSPPVVARYVRYRPLDNRGDNCCISTAQLRVMTGQTGGSTVTFQNLSSAGFGSFHWDFGDGNSSTESSPSHTFAAPGDYTVTLTASNGSATSSFSLVQHVLASTNLSLVVVPSSPIEGQSTQFTATLTPPTGAHITQATLDFGDTFSASVLTGAATHIFQNPGTFTLKLTTVDDRGTTTSIQQPITVSAGPAIATPKAFFDPQSGSGRNVALLEAGARVDAVSGQYGGCYSAATLLNYASNDCSWASANGQTTDQWIKVALVGGKTYQIDHVMIMPRADYWPQRPVHIAIDVSTTTDDDAEFTRVLTATLADNGSLQDFPLPRPVLAKFVRYREFDNRGDGCCISTSQLKIMTGQEGNPAVTFNNLSTPDKVTFHWDFGDGTSSTERSPSHTFPSGSASYTVRLQATDTSGVTDTLRARSARAPATGRQLRILSTRGRSGRDVHADDDRSGWRHVRASNLELG